VEIQAFGCVQRGELDAVGLPVFAVRAIEAQWLQLLGICRIRSIWRRLAPPTSARPLRAVIHMNPLRKRANPGSLLCVVLKISQTLLCAGPSWRAVRDALLIWSAERM
jgi:hypothetical protein